MSKKTKLILVIASVLIITVLAVTFIGAAIMSKDSRAILKHVLGIETLPEEANGDIDGNGEVDIFDALMALKMDAADKAFAYSIALDDDSYVLGFERNRFEYTVKIPEGHPAVPQVVAKGTDGVTVDVQQAFMAADAKSAKAYVYASNGAGTVSTYTITFEKTAEAGFELQYDDRYKFEPSIKLSEGQAYTFTSSNPKIVSVDEATGEMTAKMVTTTDVTITATCGEITETMTVTEVEKAHVNLFLLTGQSNGNGCYGNSGGTAGDPGYISNADQLKDIPLIGVDGAVYSYDTYPLSYNPEVKKNTFYDMNQVKRTGIAAALGKEFYALSGEKVVFLQTAYSGAPIQSWLDPDTREEAGYYGATAKRNFYDATQTAYAELMKILDTNNFEVVRTCNFWWHGGTATVSTYDYEAMDYVSGKTKMTDQEYYDLFMMMHEDMVRDFGLDYNFMILNRIQKAACSEESKQLYRHTDLVPIRAAQFALTNNNDDIIMVSTVGDIATPYIAADKENPGWNYVGLDNVHFNQIGHNATGVECGTNAFYALKNLFVDRQDADHVEIIDTNGRDRLTLDNTIEIKAKTTYRIAALAYPIYTEDITYTSSNEKVAKINEFGLITALSNGYTTITAKTDSGKSQSVEVHVYSVEKQDVTYRWDFDDLTSSGAANTLTLSELSEANYKLEGGRYIPNSSGRPDFNISNPIKLNSENAWEIEWCGYFKSTSFLFGNYNDDSSSTSAVGGRIYNGYAADFDYGAGEKYLLRFIPDKGEETQLIFGTSKTAEFVTANTKTNTWKIAYTPEDNMLAIYLQKGSEAEGYTWELVDSQKAGIYSVTFDNLFGRPYNSGKYNFYGEMDYIQVKCVKEAVIQEKNFRYDFNGNLLSSAGKNDLTLSPEADARGAVVSEASFSEGKYYVSNENTAKKRPDFLFENPIRISNKMDWSIEWRAKLSISSQLLGQSLTDAGKTHYGCIYLAYGVSGNGYSLRFKTFDMSSSATGYRIPYGDYKNKNTSLNTWKLEHKADTQVMTLYFKGTNGWETVGSVSITADYDFTFTNLFGTYQDSACANLKGTVDYVEIYTKETIYQ